MSVEIMTKKQNDQPVLVANRSITKVNNKVNEVTYRDPRNAEIQQKCMQ